MKLPMNSEKEEASKPKIGLKKLHLRPPNSNCKFFKNKCFNIRCNPQVKPRQSKTVDSIQILKYKKQICKQLSYLNSVKCAEIKYLEKGAGGKKQKQKQKI